MRKEEGNLNRWGKSMVSFRGARGEGVGSHVSYYESGEESTGNEKALFQELDVVKGE